MWLLDTRTLRLHYFVSPQAVKEGYAILSHVWDKHEQSFQDVQNIHQCAEPSSDDSLYAHNSVSPKIRGFCKIARSQGYRWGWVDTCCIDKTSSAELSEAINSMFLYYTLSQVCYAYLGDVPTHAAVELRSSKYTHETVFAKSRWHTRGWTLQELIAPRVVHFLSGTWEYIGSKNNIADKLQHITHIPASVLRFEKRPTDVCVARRMAWSADRVTTRVEDEAYCLLGIFDINMPTLYGEGPKAFRRLQEEILRNSPDTTLFAWGKCWDLKDLLKCPEEPFPPEKGEHLFAPSPAHFRSSMRFEYSPKNETVGVSSDESSGDGFMTFTITPRGILAQIPVVEMEGQFFADLSWTTGGTDHVLLALSNRVDSAQSRIRQYNIGRLAAGSDTAVRLAMIPDAVNAPGSISSRELQRARWTELCLVHPPAAGSCHAARDSASATQSGLYIPANHTFSPPIKIPEHLVTDLAPPFRRRGPWTVTLSDTTGLEASWMEKPPHAIAITVHNVGRDTEAVALRYGRCTVEDGQEAGDGARPRTKGPVKFWTNVQVGSREVCAALRHDCDADHILAWPGLQRQFLLKHGRNGWGMWTFAVAFERSPETGTLTLTQLSWV
ncbi:heterokaryon incompatibility protein-domain-containing protein [Daedaleopsis nitida]|nr:heterokaryon incompatibility protein-domain-containing protein [Daedaleopsis nitida]